MSTIPAPARNVSIDQALQMAREHFQAGQRGEVEVLCLKVLEIEPENAQALHLLGVLAHLAGKQGIALALLEKALRVDPGQAQFQYNLGVVLGGLRRAQEALLAYRAAVALEPGHPTAWLNLGHVALELNLFDESVAAFDNALAINPADPAATLSRALALYGARRFAEAAPAYERAVQLAPGDATPRWEQAHLLLMTGDLRAGWEAYEYRFAAPRASVWSYPYPYRRWQGEALAGMTLLLHGEQGLGDEIMFASIYPELIAEAAHTIICCQPHLAQLFRDSFPAAQVIAQPRVDADAWTQRPAEWLEQAPAVDYQIAFGSLARLRRRTFADFPRHHGYLHADPARVAAWREKLAGLSGLRVGLCWAANPAIEDLLAAHRSRKKSLTLRQLEPLLKPAGAGFVSLQTWEAAAQVAAADPQTRERILDASAGLGDFADTAALVMNLDLVITVDTSVAHLAGALGKPVWIMLPWQGDWRWHAQGRATEWYPSAVLYRQDEVDDWTGLIAQVAADLNRLAKSQSSVASTRTPDQTESIA